MEHLVQASFVYERWVFKEATSKARGIGIGEIPLQELQLDEENSPYKIALDVYSPPLLVDFLGHVVEGYYAAVAIEL